MLQRPRATRTQGTGSGMADPPARGAAPARDAAAGTGAAAGGRLSRRRLLVGAGLLAAGVGGGGVLLGRAQDSRPTGPLPELPPLSWRVANDGTRSATLTAAALGGGLSYNSRSPGPVLRLREGDRVQLAFRNATDEHTSLHLHGLPLSPAVDAPLTHLMPGEQDLREFAVPAGAAGTYWYHPHAHGDVERQLLAGLAGAVVVTGPADDQPGLAGTDDRLCLLTRRGRDIAVNGVVHPLLTAGRGRLRLRLVNATASDVLRLAVLGAGGAATSMYVVATDGGLLVRPEPIEEVLLPAGGRVEVLLDAGTAGRWRLTARPYSVNSNSSGTTSDRTLLTVDVPAGLAPVPLPAALAQVEQLNPAAAVRTRRIVMDADGAGGFTIDGRTFDPDRIDITARLGTLEVWELHNAHTVDHPFHLHSYRVQVLDRDGTPPPYPAWLDTVLVSGGETVRLAVPFVGEPGRTVYHCHIASHEDLGMMAVLDVLA